MGFPSVCLRHVVDLASRIPFFGRLGEVSSEGLEQALYETFVTTFFATIPFWFIPVMGRFIFKPTPPIDEALRNGDGLIYATVLLGPLLYSLTKRYGRWTFRRAGTRKLHSALTMSFPYGGGFISITALACLVSGCAFGLLRSGAISTDINRPGMEHLSWILVGLSTAIFYLITAYKNMLEDITSTKFGEVIDEQPRSEDNFLKRWKTLKQ